MKKLTSGRFPWLILLLFLPSLSLPAQEEVAPEEAEPVDTYLTLTATYTSNDTVVLTANLFIRKGRERVDLQNAPIRFTVSGDAGAVDKGVTYTDSTGTARVNIPLVDPPLPADEEGMITYEAVFEGTGKYLPASESFISTPAALVVSFYEEDSIRYIRVTGMQGVGRDLTPVAGETVLLFVPSLFRPLQIGEIWLDEEGTGSTEFPMTLVGDSTGNLTVIARMDEHELYGNVRGENTCSWAIPKHLLAQDKPTRELWTPVAPIWMIITLLIMLAGVWAHYFWAVFELIKIKKSAKKEKFEEKDWSNYS